MFFVHVINQINQICLFSAYTTLESKLSSIETRISALEAKALNTGTSLGSICGAIDALGSMISTESDRYHCCANTANNKMACFKKTIAEAVGITTSDPQGQCLANDAFCTGE